MNATQKTTGYPSIDKPWLKYYSEEAMKSSIPECSMYDAVYQRNQANKDDIALNYFDKKITYGKLFENVEKTAKAFWKVGVRENDVVVLCTVNMPETVYAIYALNRIGAMINLVDPRTNEKGICKYINECKAKYILAVEQAYPVTSKAIVGTEIKTVIVVPVSNSMPKVTQILYGIKNKSITSVGGKNKYSWNEFIKHGKDTEPQYAKYKKDKCFILAHTGGTTGMPKSVMLSDKNVNAVMSAYQYLGIPFERKQKYFNDLPPFIIYGMTLALHITLSYGLEVILYPVFDSEKFPELFRKYKPNHFSALTDYLKNMAESPATQKMNLDFLISAGVGGDSLNPKIETQVNSFLEKHGCKYQVCKGYGMTELSATAVISTPMANAIGSVGIPLVHNTVKIMDIDSGQELKYNEVGEIWISGPSIMLGYYKNEEATSEIISEDEKGQKWIHTGDLGCMNENGLLFHKGRIRRIYLTSVMGQPAKIFPNVVEEIINRQAGIEESAVVGRYMENSAYYEPVGFVVLKDKSLEHKSVEKQIRESCEKELPSYMIPVEYRFVEKLPYTSVGKVDFRKLEAEAENRRY